MDIYLEQLVKCKKKSSDYVKIALITLAAVVLTIVGLILNFMFRQYLLGLGYLVIAAIWYAYYLFLQTFSVEYEYILVNNEMDVDKIMSKKGRKSVASVDFKNIDVCARVNDTNYGGSKDKTEGYEKVIDVSGDIQDDGVYFVDYYGENAKCRMYFRPTEKMIDAIYKFNPRNVHK